MNRIYSVPLTGAAISDVLIALRQRANTLHNLADDAPGTSAGRHWREAGKRYERLAAGFAEELAKIQAA